MSLKEKLKFNCIYLYRKNRGGEREYFINISQNNMEIKENERVLTVRDWLIIQLIMMIPILNIIMWVKWLISDKTNQNLRNFLIASFVMLILGTLSYFIYSTFLAV